MITILNDLNSGKNAPKQTVSKVQFLVQKLNFDHFDKFSQIM